MLKPSYRRDNFFRSCPEHTGVFEASFGIGIYYNFNSVEYFPVKRNGDALLFRFILN